MCVLHSAPSRRLGVADVTVLRELLGWCTGPSPLAWVPLRLLSVGTLLPDRTLRRAVRRLELAGLLTRDVPPPALRGRGGWCTVYDLAPLVAAAAGAPSVPQQHERQRAARRPTPPATLPLRGVLEAPATGPLEPAPLEPEAPQLTWGEWLDLPALDAPRAPVGPPTPPATATAQASRERLPESLSLSLSENPREPAGILTARGATLARQLALFPDSHAGGAVAALAARLLAAHARRDTERALDGTHGTTLVCTPPELPFTHSKGLAGEKRHRGGNEQRTPHASVTAARRRAAEYPRREGPRHSDTIPLAAALPESRRGTAVEVARLATAPREQLRGELAHARAPDAEREAPIAAHRERATPVGICVVDLAGDVGAALEQRGVTLHGHRGALERQTPAHGAGEPADYADRQPTGRKA